MMRGAGLRMGGGFGRPRPEENVRVFNPPLMGRLLRLMVPYRWRLALGLALMVVLAACGMAGPYMFKLAIDEGIERRELAVVVWTGVAYLVISLVEFLCRWSQGNLLARTAQTAILDMRHRLARQFQALDLAFHDRQIVGVLISRATSDVEAVNEFVASGLVSAITDLLTLAGILATMFALHAKLAAVVCLFLPVFVLGLMLFGRRIRRAFLAVRERIGVLTGTVAEQISGVRVIRAFVQEARMSARFREVNQDNADANITATRVMAQFVPLVEAVAVLALVAVMWCSGRLLAADGTASGAAEAVTLGTVTAFIGYLNRLFVPVRNLSRLYSTVQSAFAGAERVFEILDETPAVVEAPDARPLAPLSDEVRFENVSFAYPSTDRNDSEAAQAPRQALSDVSFSLVAGQRTALVGPTGAGKSTVVKLLSRFYDPQEGAVLFDGADVRGATFSSLRGQMAVVLQETFLFNGTVAENIRYGRPDATDEDVEAAARAVSAHEFILRLPQGYATPVGEDGVALSTGQRQLVAFARAILCDPRLLVLDEATSSVDVCTERVIRDALRQLLAGRTALIIAHRLSTVVDSDHILVLDRGRLVGEGTHDELLTACPLYGELYALQFRDAEAPPATDAGRPSRRTRRTG